MTLKFKTKYYMKENTFIIVFIALISVLNAQKNYKPAYIITNNNDTIYGYINLKSNTGNSEKCEFKAVEDSVAKFYNPLQIKAYRIENGKYYVSRTIVLNKNSKDVFLEFLVDGIVDLFFYTDISKGYYFIEKDSTLYQLSNDDIEKKDNGSVYRIKSNQYKGILNVLFYDNQEAFKKIKNTTFSSNSLIKITEDYHNTSCPDYKCIKYSRSALVKYYIEFFAGDAVSVMKLKNSSDNAMNNSLNVGFNMKFKPVNFNRLFFFKTGINYSYNEFDNTLFSKVYYYLGETYAIKINYSYFSLPLMIEYQMYNKKLSPFFSLGYNNIFLFNSFKKVNLISNDQKELTNTELRKYQFGITGQAGLRYQFNNKSYVQISVNTEYRKSFQNLLSILDFHYVESILFNVGYGIGF